jgi:hypothetical protein
MQIVLTHGIDGLQIPLNPARFENPVIRQTEFGFGAFSVTYRCEYSEAVTLVSRFSLFLRVLEYSKIFWQGRVQSIRIVPDGVSIAALGAVQIINDIMYNNWFSCVDYGRWQPDDLFPFGLASQWTMDNNNRLFFAPKNNFTYPVSNYGAIYRFYPPYPTNRKAVGITFDYEIAMPTNWYLEVHGYNEPEYAAGLTVATYQGTGIVPITGSVCLTNTGRDYYILHAIYRGGAPTTLSSTVDPFRITVTNLRVVTDINRMVNTTTSTAILGAGSQTINVGSTLNMIVGQRVVVGTAPAVSESVFVEAINPGVSFTASFFKAQASGVAVKGFSVNADTIIGHIIGLYNGANPNQINATTAFLTNPNVDLTEAIYENRRPSDVFAELASIGDGTQQYEVGATLNNAIYFRPKYSAGLTYYVTLTNQQIELLLDQMYNFVSATYNDVSRGIAKTGNYIDSVSQQRYGLTRQLTVAVGGTSSIVAEKIASAALADYKDLAVRTQISINQLYSANSARVSPLVLKSGDQLVVRNLPLGAPQRLDELLRAIRIADVTYKPDTDSVDVTTAIPIPRVDFLLANSRRKLLLV